MKVENRTEVIPERYIEKTVYVAKDGKEFGMYDECWRYEKNLEIMEHPVSKSKKQIEDIFYDDITLSVYYISSFEDWHFFMKYLVDTNRSAGALYDNYGAGWYVVRHIDGGDHNDTDIVLFLEDLVKNCEEIFDKWRNDIFTKFNI